MQETFYFYDLETSGLNSRTDRIMQFAGQRTDLNFQPIGEPTNLLIALAEDTLPNPGAIMVTGITPNSTRTDGMTEREFCQYFIDQIATPHTTMTGYNSIRFDDEFMRHTLWRNFYDPYEWQWQDGRSSWDLLDVVRMTRALRPEGIEWPLTPEGKPTNRLELITKCNGIEHTHAHDALSDVEALISVTKLIKEKQPQLFDFLYGLRKKRDVMRLINLDNPQPFVYASGRYPSKTAFTTVAYPIAPAANNSLLVYDLRHNLDELLQGEAAARENGTFDKKKPYREREIWERDYFPVVKKLQFNHCPAVAPIGVLGKENGWDKVSLNETTVQQNLESLRAHPEFIERMAALPRPEYGRADDVESMLYDGFLQHSDQRLCAVVRRNGADELADFHPEFQDERLPELLLHYKAKNFPAALSELETEQWETYRTKRLDRQGPKFLKELQDIQIQLAQNQGFNGKSVDECRYLAEELMLWYQNLQNSDY